MLLVDKDIKERVNKKELILDGYNEKNLNGVSYDLTIDIIIDSEGREHQSYTLSPGEVLFVRTVEKLNIPNDILGRVSEKNSRMRQGLKVDAPYYQPGHITYAFPRVQNISTSKIELDKGDKIAQIMFEELKSVPDTPYSAQKGASFQDEVNYRGLGNYKKEYETKTKKEVEKAKEDIENMSQRIYANVLTIMGILVAIFSLLSVNCQLLTAEGLNIKYVVTINLTLALCIVVMMGIILIFINNAKNKKFLFVYIAILILLILALVITGFCLF